ncbi:hypothetical protein [Xenorhabdus sp. PB62.4]|nr:hypothetical protein [Xenorhabdus sp. PB62.4]
MLYLPLPGFNHPDHLPTTSRLTGDRLGFNPDRITLYCPLREQ